MTVGRARGMSYADWLTVDTPAAGAAATYTVPGQFAARLLAARLTITTDANAANRFISLDYIDTRGTTRLRNAAGLVVTASTTAQAFEWSAQRTVSEWAANTPVLVPLAPWWLPPGFKIKFAVDSIQATDAISGLSLWIETMRGTWKETPVGLSSVFPVG